MSTIAQHPHGGKSLSACEDRQQAALSYYHRGLTPLPTRPRSKRPLIRWKACQSTRPDEHTVSRWFDRAHAGIALLLGSPSGDVACRDFDCHQAYEQWAADYPRAANILPTVNTPRGRHVLFGFDPGDVPRGRMIFRDDFGETKFGGYSMLPNSEHPSGAKYQWFVPLEEIPFVSDLYRFGLAPRAWSDPLKSSTEPLPQVHNIVCAQLESNGAVEWRVSEAVRQTIPTGYGQRNRKIFELACRLKAVPEIADLMASDLFNTIGTWHRFALPTIRTKDFAETLKDFRVAWGRVTFPYQPTTLATLALQSHGDGIERLQDFCRRLQAIRGDEPFFLAGRVAGRLMGVSGRTGTHWLARLVEDGVLEIVTSHSYRDRLAREYRFQGGSK